MIIGTDKGTWLRRVALGLAACVFVAGTAGQAAAQEPAKPADTTPPAPDPDKVTLNFFKNTEIGGLVDGYYDYYSTKTSGLYRNFDTEHNAFTLNMAELWIAKAPAADSPVGYKVRLNYGPAASNLIAFNEPGGPLVNVEEAYGSFLAGKAQIDFGKFVTNAGAEVIEAKDNWNYSRGLLFALAIPYYHAGLRMTYTANDKVSFMAGLVNGWNNVAENNSGKTFMASVTLKPTGNFSFIENYIVGSETPDNATTRNLSDTVLTYTAGSKLSLMGNLDFGADGGAHWQGYAGYLKYQAAPKFAIVPRYEFYNDGDGFSTGTAQNLREFTTTLELKGADNLLFRIEYRGDWSDHDVFTSSSGTAKSNQQSISFGLLYSFSSKS
jgi:Putative beta-barrel porin-2, OmpL-like. bbp2